jgi:hypothetical protein
VAVKIDPSVEFYNPAENDYALDKDPRCLWGWGPPSCNCRFGHMCCRELGHPGKCDDSNEHNPSPCEKSQRPKDWDARGRAEANQ